jgi:hypothetical protein
LFCAIAAEPSIRNTKVVSSLRIWILQEQSNALPGRRGSHVSRPPLREIMLANRHEFGG